MIAKGIIKRKKQTQEFFNPPPIKPQQAVGTKTLSLVSEIQQMLAGRELNNAVELEDARLANDIIRRNSETRQRLADLDSKTEDVETLIESASGLLSLKTDNENKEIDDCLPGVALHETLDCISCGKPISNKKFASHLLICFAKKESYGRQVNRVPTFDDGFCNAYDSRTNSYCCQTTSCSLHQKKGENHNGAHLCGCPSIDFSSGYCERLRENCPKHLGWQILRRSEVFQEKKQSTQLLEQIENEARTLHARVSAHLQSN